MKSHRMRIAFTLAEAVVASVIVAVVIVTAMNAIGSVRKAEMSATQRAFGVRLAASLLEEIMAAEYFDPQTKSDSIGIDAGEDISNRKSLDDVDDYHGLSDSPPTQLDGSVIAGANDWSRSVEVVWSVASDPMQNAAASEGSKRVTVTVRRGLAVAAALSGLRSRDVPAFKE